MSDQPTNPVTNAQGQQVWLTYKKVGDSISSQTYTNLDDYNKALAGGSEYSDMGEVQRQIDLEAAQRTQTKPVSTPPPQAPLPSTQPVCTKVTTPSAIA